MNSTDTELQLVTTAIAAARSRLSVAKMSNNLGLVRTLEEAIAAAEARRAALRAGEVAPGEAAASPVEDVEPAPDPQASPEPDSDPEPAEGVAAAEDGQTNDAEDAEPSSASEGVSVMSNEIVPIDAIECASRQLEARRAEMLARHTEELQALDADQKEIDAMAQAMSAFVRKFNLGSPESSVVQLDDERDMRLQSHG